ncbi:MAG: hypothetical protein WDN75_09135 [Bacteroidota bacterium]
MKNFTHFKAIDNYYKMHIRLFQFIPAVIFLSILSCKSVPESKSTPEQIALTYFSDSLLLNKNTFRKDGRETMIYDHALDTTWIENGLFYGCKILGSSFSNGISRPYFNKKQLEETRHLMDTAEVRRSIEFLNDYEVKSKQELSTLYVDLPGKIKDISSNGPLEGDQGHTIFLTVNHFIQSSDAVIVEISVLDGLRDYSFIIFLDRELKVIDWELKR